MADFQQNYLSSLAGGLQIGQQIKQQRDTSQINRLAGLAYGADPGQREQIQGQMVAINPQMAQHQEQANVYSDERRNKTMVNMARMLMGAPEQARAGIYRQMVPTLSRFGMSELPQDYTPETAGVINQAAKSLVDASIGANGRTIQSQKISDDGYIINTYRDGRMEKTQQKVDRQMWLRDHPGMAAPELVGKDGAVLQVGQELGGSVPQGRQQEVPAPGLYNTPNGQARIGDQLTPEQWELAQADMANSGGSNGYQLPSRDVSPQQFQRGGTPRQTFARPSAAQDAAATERAKQGVINDNFENELEQQRRLKEQEARIEAEKAAAVESAKAQVEREKGAETRQRDAGTALDLIAEARRLLPDATGGGAGAAADATAGFFGHATAGAEANAALKTIAGQMTSKMPRMEGPQSDRDVQMYKEMAGDIGNASLPVRIRLAALNQIERLNQKYAKNPSGPSGPAAGVVEDGYRFKGGNPADPNNWERM